MQYVHSLLHLLLSLLMVVCLKAPREIQALLAFLGEMASLAFQDNQGSLVLLVPLESVNHVQLVARIILPNSTHMMSSLEWEEWVDILGQLVHQALQDPLVPLDILDLLVLLDTKVLLVNRVKLVLQALQDLLVLLVHLDLQGRMESQEDPDDLESVDCLDLQVSKAQLACLDSLA